MKVGGRRRAIVPPKLGYGDKGSAPKIPGKSTLVFEIELLAVNEVVDGGAGDDTYLVDDAGDLVTEAAGQGIDTVRTAMTPRVDAERMIF